MTSETTGVPVLNAPTMLQLGQRVIGAVVLVAVAVLGVWLWLAWEHVRTEQLARMHTTVRLIAAHADHYFISLGHRLERLASDLQKLDPLAQPASVRGLLNEFTTSMPDVINAALVRPDGQIVMTATAAPGDGNFPNLQAEAGWREEFERDRQATGLRISYPRPDLLRKVWVVPVRHAVRDHAGRLRYFLQAGIPLDRQQALWRDLGLGGSAALGLLRTDGYLISRLPEGEGREQIYGRQIIRGALVSAIREDKPESVYEGKVVVDGSYRIGVYRRLSSQPMVAFLSEERSAFVGLWWGEVRWPLTLVVVFLGVGILTYVLMARRYADRMREIEERMAFADASPELPSSGVQEIDMLMAALAQSRDKLRAAAHNREKLLLSAAEAGTYVVRERDGVVLNADATLLAMLKRDAAAVIGQPLLWPMVDDPRTDNDGAELARRIVWVELPNRREVRWLALAEYRETLLDGERVRHGLAIDVTDREDLLNQLDLQSRRLQALWQLATTRGASDAEKRWLMLHLARERLYMDAVLMNEVQGDVLVVREAADGLGLLASGQEFPWRETLCRRAIREQTSSLVPDLRADPELRDHPLVTEHGVQGFASIPVFAGNELYGTLVFLRRSPLPVPFNDERVFMELMAAWFGQMLLEAQQRSELERLAMTDTLTRLTNRRAAEARLQEEYARAGRGNGTFSIAVCDLDRFKLINDHYGHDTGDKTLLHVAEILKAALREGDWVARWGGEEFLIFLHEADAASAYIAMERLRLAIKGNPVTTAHGPLAITASIGIGTWRGGSDLAAVLSEADGCLYEAKRAGRDRVVMSESSRHGTLWRAGMLQHALLENRIVPAYQVIVDLKTREVVADESLARIVEPDGRIIAAGEFIEAAEGINLIHLVDEAVVRQSMRRCALDICQGRAAPGFAHFVNLSAQFLSRRELVQALLNEAAAYCVETGLTDTPVKPLVLEITERQLIGNFDDLLGDLQPLVDFGFRLALDDFGSGYSSFLYLAKLPVSFLKIEGWMVQNLRSSPRVLAMVKSIIALARDQGITTIAEFVEDAATADLLAELGADWAQGWYFGRPQCDPGALRSSGLPRAASG